MSLGIFRIPFLLPALAFGAMAGEQPFARTVAVVWDGSGASTPEQSWAGQMLRPVLVRLGLRARYVSVHQPLPDLRTDRDVRAVVSFLDRNRMPDPLGYTAWVEGLAAKGKYFVCLGDPGTDYDEQGKATPASVRARFWKLVGLVDTGRWVAVTYDQRVLTATNGLIGFERPIGAVLPPYRVTVPSSSGVQSHLVVGAPGPTKGAAPKAHLVVTGPLGGYVAAGYSHVEPAPGRRQWYIDPVGFLERALHVADAPKPDPSVISGRRVLVVVAQANTQRSVTAGRGPRFETKVQRLAAEFPTLPISFGAPSLMDGIQTIAITAEDLERSARTSRLEKSLREAQTDRVLPTLAEDHRVDSERAARAWITQVDSMIWKVGPGLATLRFDHADRLHVDFAHSTGVIGANHRRGSLYVALDPEVRESRIALSSAGTRQSAVFPLLVDARWRVSGVQRSAGEVRCRVKGYGPGEMTWQVPQDGEWWVEAPATGRRFAVKAGRDGLLTTAIPLSAVKGLDIVLRRRM
ncbi:MAG: hypothetical protein IT168_12280 [Bryobacterales bacterium]|nr:hypothetical protein [Bryobacterales bacterium]